MLGFIEILGKGQLKPEFETQSAYFDSIFQHLGEVQGKDNKFLKRILFTGPSGPCPTTSRGLSPALIFFKGPKDRTYKPTKFPTKVKDA